MRYISHSLPTTYGVPATCWIVTDIRIRRLTTNPIAVLTIEGWASVEAFENGAPSIDARRVEVESIEATTVPVTTPVVVEEPAEGEEQAIPAEVTQDVSPYDLVGTVIVSAILQRPEWAGAQVIQMGA
jgi:hypothetical protein